MTNNNVLPSNGLMRSSLFGIPYEIRAAILSDALDFNRSDDWEENIIFPRPLSREMQCKPYSDPDQPDIKEPEPAQEMRPSKLALAMTCRQAYREASQFYYSRHHFRLESGPLLNRFVKDLQPGLIQMIKQLTIDVRTRRNKKADPFGEWDPFNEFNQFSMDENRGPRSLAIIEHFHGLEELHFFNEHPADKPCKEFIQFLAAHASGMKQLKYIVFSSWWFDRIENAYKSFELDPAELPGWTYQIRIGRAAMIYEILKPIPEGFKGNAEELPTYDIQCRFEKLIGV